MSFWEGDSHRPKRAEGNRHGRYAEASPAAGEPPNEKGAYSAEESLVRGGEDMSEQEKKMMQTLAELAEKMPTEARTAWLAYGMGLADGAKTVEVQQAAG